MKKGLLWALGVIAVLVIIGIFVGGGDKANRQKTEETNPNGNTEALELIKKEPKVKEAIITDANILYVSVDDDGTKRDGYASYLCEILREKKAKARTVKVVRVNSTNDPNRDNAYGVLLGKSNCK